jgi:hypothetical protein
MGEWIKYTKQDQYEEETRRKEYRIPERGEREEEEEKRYEEEERLRIDIREIFK